MIRGGQLDAAIEYIESVDVAYVTIDIGANDLLGHLGSDDCSDDIDSPDCSKRLEAAFTTYEANLSVILERLAVAAPDAPVVYLTAYNPFSLGLAGGVGFEGRSDAIVAAFNALGTEVAEGLGVIVADGFGPMRGTTAATTHMLDAEPDIHPKSVGYGILAWAIIEALAAS
jgi:lysophospholipase L1-like esterase